MRSRIKGMSFFMLFPALLWALPTFAQNPFWYEPLRFTNSPYLTNHAEMAESEGIIHVVCTDEWSYGEIGAYYYHMDGGLSFSQGIRLDADTSWWAKLPKVTASGLMVHTVYSQYLNGNPYPYVAYRRSLDGGFHWEDAVLLGSGGADGVSCQGDSVYILYTGYDEPLCSFFRYSYDRGEHWSTPDTLVPFTQACDFTACDGQVFIAYQHYTYPLHEIYLRRSPNGGQSWEDPVQVSLSPGIPSQWPHMAVDPGGFMAVSWFDHENAPPGFTGWVHVRTSSDYGENFDSVEVVSTTPYCEDNDVAVCEGTIRVAYNDERWGISNSGVYYRQSLDRGLNWDPEEALCADSSSAQGPTIVAQGNWVYVAWEALDTTGYDLYFIAGEEALGVKASLALMPPHVGLQLYPNPANPVTFISFSLPYPQEATLAVYNLLGARVTTLTSGLQPPGEQSFLWGASRKASGVYIARLEVAGEMRAGKIVVMK